MGRKRDFNEFGPTIYPRYVWSKTWNHSNILLSHAKGTAEREPRAIEAIKSSIYRFKKTPTWIQALTNSNEGIRPRCSKVDCGKLAEHGAHMLWVWESDEEEWTLINTKTGQKETERQHLPKSRLVIPLCRECHQSGLVDVSDITELTWDEIENNLYLPDVIIIDSMTDDDLIPDDDYFPCPGCKFDDVSYPQWHHSNEYHLPIDPCMGCKRTIFSSTRYSPLSSDERCECEFPDYEGYDVCSSCGLYVHYDD